MSLVAVDLVKHFGGLTAVDGFSIEVHRSEIVGLIGANGAGKSTSFDLLTGITRPDGGQVWLDDQEITGLRPWDRARLGLARTFQHTALFPGLSFDDNMALSFAAARRVLPPDRSDRVAELRELLEIPSARSTAPVGGMAYGIQRRMAIAVALANRPRYVLLDEPAAGLNPDETLQLGDALRQVSGVDVGVCLVEHDLELVGRVADRIEVLAFGAPIFSGSFSAAVRDPKVIESYLGEGAADA